MKDSKRRLLITGIIISILIIIASITTSIIVIINRSGVSRTIMIYMVGSNLESTGGLASADLNSIDKNIDSNTRVMLIAGGSKKWSNNYISTDETSIYELTGAGFTKVKNQPKLNMGSSETLSSFLNYVYDYSKTDAYDLIFWNHGGAIDGSEYDELSNDDNLSLSEMNNALSNSPFNNKKLELVIFRTCLNGTIEINSIFSKYAKYLVASEEETLGASYTSVLNFINNINSKDSSKIVGRKFIDAYKKQINDIKSNTFETDSDTIYSTYSLVNLSNIDNLNKSVNEFFNDIDVTTNFNKISKVRANLYQYAKEEPSYDMVDLYNLVNNLKDLSPTKADKVLKNLDNTIIYNYATDANSRGISIYFPYNGKKIIKDRFIDLYNDIDGFNDYKNFITKFYSIQSGDYKSYTYTSNVVNSKESTTKNTYADFELELTDEQVETFAKATYVVYKDLGTGYYKPVYSGISTTLDGNVLKASIKDRQLQVVGSNAEVYDLTAFEKENTDKYIKYTTNVVLQSFGDKISDFKNDNAVMTLYYDKNTDKTNIANVVYNNNDDKTNAIAINLNDYNNVVFSVSSGWKILDDTGNYTGPIIENGKVVGDGIITGFEEKPGKFKFELSKFDDNSNYYCVFALTDTHNNVSYSKLIKLR